MLKGHVFKKQTFESEMYALAINNYYNSQSGIYGNYGNDMKITTNGSNLTITNGAACICGRILEEDTSTTLNAGTDTAFCRLVIEIDLDKENTDTEFKQAEYKILKSTSGYPDLTQADIVKNVAGVYQFELARFKTSANGISEFAEIKNYLSYANIYKMIEDKINAIEDGSGFLPSDKIKIGKDTPIASEMSEGDIYLQYFD